MLRMTVTVRRCEKPFVYLFADKLLTAQRSAGDRHKQIVLQQKIYRVCHLCTALKSQRFFEF